MRRVFALCCVTLWGLAARAGSPAEFVTVGSYVPADVHFYAGGKTTSERARLVRVYADACQKLWASGIVDDVVDLATTDSSREERQQVRAVVARVLGILSAPNWSALFEHEAAFAFKIVLPIPEYLLLCKVAPGTGPERFNELKTLLAGVAEFAPHMLSVSSSAQRGAETAALQIGGAPVGLSLAARGDTVIMTTSPVLLSRVFDLMDAQDPAGSIVSAPRFKGAFAKLAPAMDSQVFFDFEGYIRTVQGFVSLAGMQAGNDPRAARLLGAVNTMMEELALLKTIASVEYTKGDRMFVDTCVTLGQRDGPGFIERLVAAQEPLRGYARVVPADASAFWLASGIDPLKIYDPIVALVRDMGPEGEQALAQWGALQERAGCNLREDVLSWIEGGCGWICLPVGSSGSAAVAYLRVRDEEKARAFIDRVLERACGFLRERGQPVELAAIEGYDGLKEIRIAALPFARPVVGVVGSTFIVSCSKNAVARVAATFKGEAPSMADNPRFAALEVPEGHVTELSYWNTEHALSGIANVLGVAGFGASLAPRTRETRPVLKMGAILSKLAAFVRDIDVSLDYATWTVYDAEAHTVTSRQMEMVTVPPPPPPPPPAPAPVPSTRI